MQFSFLHFGLLASASTIVSQPIASPTIEVRQLGGGPNAGKGAGWDVNWSGRSIWQPTNFKSTALGNNAFDVTFKRDARSDKYLLSYWIAYVSGGRYLTLPYCEKRMLMMMGCCSSGQEETQAVDLKYVGSSDAQGFQIYSTRLPNAESSRFTVPTSGIRIYFSPRDMNEVEWVTTIRV
jgi:hypothetical protein